MFPPVESYGDSAGNRATIRAESEHVDDVGGFGEAVLRCHRLRPLLDGIRFYHPGCALKPVTVETDVHPGFMTDWQQPLIVALTQASGVSIVHETVYENRLGFTKSLNEMGANIVVHPHGLSGVPRRVARRDFEQAAVITGPTKLHGADVLVPDLRGELGGSHAFSDLKRSRTQPTGSSPCIAYPALRMRTWQGAALPGTPATMRPS